MKFLNRALAALNGVFRFEGGLRSIDRLDLSAPVTTVYDASRIAEYASGFFYGEGVTQETDGIGTVARTEYVPRNTLLSLANVVAEMRLRGFQGISDVEIWLTRITCSVSDNLAALAAGYIPDGPLVYEPAHSQLIYLANNAASFPGVFLETGGNRIPVAYVQPASAVPVNPVGIGTPLPVPFRRLGSLWLLAIDDATGAMTADWTLTFWIGPQGVYPPVGVSL